MPIEFRLDHSRRLVVARGVGRLTDADVFGYQRDVWSRPDVTGYDELIDMTGALELEIPSSERIRELANLSAAMERTVPGGRFAIVAPQNVAYGLGRMYEAYRDAAPGGMKQVAVFRSIVEAHAFLGIEGALEPWPEA